MDTDKKMEVVDWRESPQPKLPKYRGPRRFLSPTFIGIFGTLLLHTIFIQAVPFGSRSPKVKPPEIQEFADTLSKSKTDSAERLVLIALPVMADSIQTAPQNFVSSLPDLKKMKIKSLVDADPPGLLNIEALALGEDHASRPTGGSGDGAAQARLFGIYTGQIHARINRVWRRPRTPVNEGTSTTNTTDIDDSFQCEAQIVQDVHGNVQEILLPRCNGSVAWQRSLVLAIQQASPLPAPPSASVFSQSISLNFIGFRFLAGAAEDDYEPERRMSIYAQ